MRDAMLLCGWGMRKDLVPEEGVEPTRPCGHRILSPARLPVPPLGHVVRISQDSRFPWLPADRKKSPRVATIVIVGAQRNR
jgi:hypothetical protein